MVDWTFEPIFPFDVWLGFANLDRGSWTWFTCPASNLLTFDVFDPYMTGTGDVLLAVAMTGTFDTPRLHSLNLNAGDNEAPVADLVIASNGGSVNGPTTLDASGSTDTDGTIATYEWDFDGDGTWDQSGAEATLNHTFASTGNRDVSVRVTDDRGEADTAMVNIGVYSELEDNDDGIYNSSATTAEDIAASNALPVVDFTGFTGNCGSGGYGDDREDYFAVNITAPGWYTFIAYYIDAESDIDMRLLEDVDGSYAELARETTTTDNASFTYEFTAAKEYYWQIWCVPTTTNADFMLEIKSGQFNLPDASFTATPDEGDRGLVVSFDASASSDSDGSIVLYEWDYDGDGTYDYSDSGPTTNHTYNDSGGFEATLRVTDDTDLTDKVAHTIVIFGAPPVADLQATPLSGTAPLTVTFDASGSTPLGGIETYRYDWNNDGTYDDGYSDPIQILTYYVGGTFTVGLRVEDYQGQTDETTVTITVSPISYSETEVNDTYQTADVLPALDFANWTGAVGPIDEPSPDPEDWSSFTIPGSGEVRIYMILTDRLGDIDIALFDSDGTTELEDSVDIDDDEEIIWHFDAAGTYFIQTYMYSGSSDKRGGYKLDVSFTAD